MAAIPTRRVVLATAATLPLAALSGCGGVDVLAAPPQPSRDVRLLRAAIAAEELMIARYSAVLRGARDPGTATSAARSDGSPPAGLIGNLQPLLAEHQAHLAQLRSRLIVPPGGPAGVPSFSARPPKSPPPAGTGAAVAFLRSAEQAAAAAMLARLPGIPAALAQLFASISASEATHVPILDAALAATAAMKPAGEAG